MLVVILHPEQWNGGSDRCTIGMIRHFVGRGHRVIWYTTMIDRYWSNQHFEGVGLSLCSQFLNVLLGHLSGSGSIGY
ncbi:unnamed protein product [Gongylonema pulchrum]|uniref:Glyco_trans_4-like_N domain-containing protein n=1 Tax=Gongylonema pulchrum TaxID=637853 RepID=A0A183DJA0_9BILA|nr:unnamed protein product [Gongylonema pulchrum]